MKRKNVLFLTIAVLVVILFSGCADVSTVCATETENIYGFWGGLWHGMIAGIAFIGSLLNDEIAIYAINNSGGWYDFGFLLGVGTFTHGIIYTKQ